MSMMTGTGPLGAFGRETQAGISRSSNERNLTRVGVTMAAGSRPPLSLVVQRVSLPPFRSQLQTSAGEVAALRPIASDLLSGENARAVSTPTGSGGWGRARRVRKSRTTTRDWPFSLMA